MPRDLRPDDYAALPGPARAAVSDVYIPGVGSPLNVEDRPSPRTAQVRNLPAPIAGLNDAPFATREGTAAQLENFIPTRTGLTPRPGIVRQVDGASAPDGTTPPSALIPYSDGLRERLFAAWNGKLYWYVVDIAASPERIEFSGPSGLDGALSGQTFTGDGGSYAHIVNGADDLILYQGTGDDVVMVDGDSTPAITGVDTDSLSYVFTYKTRVFFVEGRSTNIWYLDPLAITGAATKLPLQGIFPVASTILFGTGWSIEAGDTLDERVAFVTTTGHVAVYGGSPGGMDFRLEGVWNIGVPLGKHCHFQFGDDVYVGTTEGLVSLTRLLANRGVGSPVSYVTREIRNKWGEATRLLGPSDYWRAAVWSARGLAFVFHGRFPNNHPAFGVNMETGAWFEVTFTRAGRRIVSAAEVGDRFFMLDEQANLHEFTGQSDNGDDIRCLVRWTPINFLNGVGVTRMRSYWSGQPVRDRKTIGHDRDGKPSPPDDDGNVIWPPALDRAENTNRWGVAKWGLARWGGVDPARVGGFRNAWATVHRTIRHADVGIMAPTIQATVNYPSESTTELSHIELEISETERRPAA